MNCLHIELAELSSRLLLDAVGVGQNGVDMILTGSQQVVDRIGIAQFVVPLFGLLEAVPLLGLLVAVLLIG